MQEFLKKPAEEKRAAKMEAAKAGADKVKKGASVGMLKGARLIIPSSIPAGGRPPAVQQPPAQQDRDKKSPRADSEYIAHLDTKATKASKPKGKAEGLNLYLPEPMNQPLAAAPPVLTQANVKGPGNQERPNGADLQRGDSGRRSDDKDPLRPTREGRRYRRRRPSVESSDTNNSRNSSRSRSRSLSDRSRGRYRNSRRHRYEDLRSGRGDQARRRRARWSRSRSRSRSQSRSRNRSRSGRRFRRSYDSESSEGRRPRVRGRGRDKYHEQSWSSDEDWRAERRSPVREFNGMEVGKGRRMLDVGNERWDKVKLSSESDPERQVGAGQPPDVQQEVPKEAAKQAEGVNVPDSDALLGSSIVQIDRISSLSSRFAFLGSKAPAEEKKSLPSLDAQRCNEPEAAKEAEKILPAARDTGRLATTEVQEKPGVSGNASGSVENGVEADAKEDSSREKCNASDDDSYTESDSPKKLKKKKHKKKKHKKQKKKELEVCTEVDGEDYPIPVVSPRLKRKYRRRQPTYFQHDDRAGESDDSRDGLTVPVVAGWPVKRMRSDIGTESQSELKAMPIRQAHMDAGEDEASRPPLLKEEKRRERERSMEGRGKDGRERGPVRSRSPVRRRSGRSHSRSHSSASSDRSPVRTRPRGRMRAWSRSRSRSRSRQRGRSGYRRPSSQSPRRARRLSRSPSRSRSLSRERSLSQGRTRVSVEERSKEDIAADIAKAAETAWLAAMQPQPGTGASFQLSRHARRVYVGGLPVAVSEVEITQFFNNLMTVTNACTKPGFPIISCYMNPEKRFAFVEFRSVEETSNAMALDGVTFNGETLKIRRPHDYNAQAAALLGPTEPGVGLNLATLGVVNTLVADGPNKIFIGGLPSYLGEDQVRSLLQMFGSLRAFNLVVDRDTGISKGYGFCEYMDISVTDTAIQGLSAISVGGKTLTVRRTQAPPEGFPPWPPLPPGSDGQAEEEEGKEKEQAQESSTILRLSNMVSRDDLKDSEEYEDILLDIVNEVEKYGSIRKVVVPRPADAINDDPKGVGLVFMEFEDQKSASRAQVALDKRKFLDRYIESSLFDKAKYDTENYE